MDKTDQQSGEVSQLHYTEVDDWEEWYAQMVEDISVLVPDGETADVTVTVGVRDEP